MSSDLEDCGEHYAIMVALTAGITLGPIVAVAAANTIEPQFLSWGLLCAGVIAWYLLIGLCAYFLFENSNVGAWHERGGW